MLQRQNKDIRISGTTDIHIKKARRGIYTDGGNVTITDEAKIRMYDGGDSNRTGGLLNAIATQKGRLTVDGNAYDVSKMFDIDVNAGTAIYSVVAESGQNVGEGTLSASMLNITKAGTIKIKVETAANGVYLPVDATAILTVKKGTADNFPDSGNGSIRGGSFGQYTLGRKHKRYICMEKRSKNSGCFKQRLCGDIHPI